MRKREDPGSKAKVFYLICFESRAHLEQFVSSLRTFLRTKRSARYRHVDELEVWAHIDPATNSHAPCLYASDVAMQAAAAGQLDCAGSEVVTDDRIPRDARRVIRPRRPEARM